MNDISLSTLGNGQAVAIEVEGLRKLYGRITALAGVDLKVAGGVIFGLVGPNGAGKTTLIKALVGALKPTDGTIQVMGLDPIQERWELRRQIGYMPQAVALYSDLSARANLRFFNRAQSMPDLEKQIDHVLEFTELSQRADDPLSTFSGGMQKRVSLACALAHQPKMIFLDEPTAAVDPHLRFRMWDLFRGLANQGTTLLVSTHLMEEAVMCDQVAVLRRGKIIANDSPENLLLAGRASLSVIRRGERYEETIPATPQALADNLHHYGLAEDVEAVSINPDSLEDVILNIIQDQGESS